MCSFFLRWLQVVKSVLSLGGSETQLHYVACRPYLMDVCLKCLLLLFVAFNSAGCQTATSSLEVRPAGMPVKLGTVRSSVLDECSTYLAALKSRRSVPLRSQVAGEILEIFIRSGDHLSRGQLLIKLDDTKQQATVRVLQATAESLRDDRLNVQETLKSLQANRQSRIARVEFTRQELTRYTDLLGQGAVSKESVDEHSQNCKIAQADLEALNSQIKAQLALVAKNEKQMKQCEAQIKEQQAQLQYFSIKAPAAGSVGDVPVKIGEYVTSTTVLTTLEEPGPLEVYINVPSNQAEKLKLGLPVRAVGEGGNTIAEGKVFFVSQEVNNADQSILAKAVFENAGNKLRTGQLINVQMVWQRTRVLLVPTSAVTHFSGKNFVFVAQTVGSGALVAAQRNIEVGEIEGDDYRVKSGVKDGDRIVLSGVQNLVDGAALSPQ